MQPSKINEVQYGSLSACKDTDIISCQSSLIVKPDENNANQWTEIPLEDHRNQHNTNGSSHKDTAAAGSAATNIFQTNAIIHSIVPFAQIRKGTCIRIPPMKWHCGGWDKQHFHDQLRIPFVVPTASSSGSSSSSSSSTSVSSSSRGIVVTLEAMARECVAVALSPRPYFELGKTYVVHFGAASNVQTVIRRRLANPTETVDVTLSSPHICSSEKFKAYWILLQNKGQVSVGVGNIPGKRCLGTLDDSMYHEIRSGVDAVKYVGLGNSALGRRAKDVKVRNVRVMSVPDAFAAFGGIPLTPYYYHPNGYEEEDNCVDGDGVGVRQEQEEEKDAALWMEYSKECEKAKKRAEKFGIEYKQPQPDAFFTWSEARKMRANPERGFITGFDIMDEKEQEKQRKRKERFFGQDDGKEEEEEEDGGDDDDMEEEEQRDDDYMLGERRNDRHKKRSNLQMVELSEAWDNEDLVGSMRVDPPECLWNKRSKSDAMEDDGNDQDPGDDMALEEENKDNSNDNNDHVKYVPTKIHLFAIDWAAFKQIRSDDILSYFRVYGPSYVEWLGELSCNIHFEDKFSASRALEGLSRVLPMEIPSTGGTKECKEIDKQGGEDVMAPSHHEEVKKAISNTNLGIMGWRLCNRPIYKIRSDRYGRRGTRSRCIVRIATSLDVLEERPSSFPKPPPGFTTHRVLGPGSDYSKPYSRRPAGPGNRYDRRGKGRQDKRRRRRRHESISDDGMNHKEDDFDQSALDRALTAPRR